MPRPALIRLYGQDCRGRGEAFTCDLFARDLQNKLDDHHVTYVPKVLGFKRIEGNSYLKERALESGRHRHGRKGHYYYQDGLQVQPKIILKEQGHKFHKKIIGNETHFWTEVTMDNGEVYCFDNLHPRGIAQQIFYRLFEFRLAKVLAEEHAYDSQRTVFDDDAHLYKSHHEVLGSTHLLVKDIPANQYIRPQCEVYKWTTKPDKYMARYPHRFFQVPEAESFPKTNKADLSL